MASTGKKLMQTYDVFVGNLPLDATEKLVGKVFSKFGEIQGIIVRDANTNPKKRYAFVNFLCEPDAERACAEVNGQDFNGYKIVVRRQEQRKKGTSKKDGDKKSNQRQSDSGSYKDQKQYNLESSSQKSNSLQNIHGDRDVMMVTYIESPVTVWLQEMSEENAEKLHNITEQVASVCPAAPKVQGQPQVNKVYAAQFSEDGLWYRCCVKQLFGTDTIKVQYIDYGNTEEINSGALVEIPQTLSSTKPLATKVVLHNAKARDLSDRNGIQFMKRLTDGKVVECIKTNRLTDALGYYAYLFIDGECINERVVQEGYASRRPDMFPRAGGDNQSRGGGGMANNVLNMGMDGGSFSRNQNSNTRNMPIEQNNWGHNPGPRDFNISNFSSGYLNSESGYNNIPNPPSNMAFNPLGRQGASNFNMGRQITGDQGGQIQIQFQRNEDTSRNEVEQNLKNNLSKKKKEVDMLRTQIAKKDLELQQATLSKVQIHNVTELAKKVRSVRQQFPTGRVSGLEEAIELAFSTEKISNSSVTSLQPVVTALSKYRAVQKEICITKDVAELEAFTVNRDEAKRQLHEKLQSCVSELSNMPLNIRYQNVKDAEEQVRKSYGSFLHGHKQGSPPLEELLPGFKSWKKKKDEEFYCVRENTNVCHGQVATLLQRLSNALNLDGEVDEDDDNFEMERMLKMYSNALHQELGVTDMESSSDASLVSTVVSSLLNELKSELNIILSFQQFGTEFSQLKEGIEPWLDKKPGVDEILEKRKQLRGLKSKLRHKEADRQDLEESGDSSEEDMNIIKTEIDFLKQQIHQLLLVHDQLVAELAKVSDEYFPELLIKFQDMGLQSNLKYNGLVRDSWDIDYYSLNPALTLGMNLTEFCGKSVYLQEYHLSDSDHLTREEFLAQVMVYKVISQKSDNILTVDAVFFQKNDRLAYIQCEHAELELLTDYLSRNDIGEKKRQGIAIGITSALQHLHEHGFVHGDVDPTHVAIKPDGSSVLLAPDFSKALFDRTRKGYVTENGLLFQAPEILNAHQSSPVQINTRSDLFCLGLLILFLHHPKSMIVVNRDGTPNLNVMSLESDVGALLYSLLCFSPETRLQASIALKSGYLSRDIPDDVVPQTPPDNLSSDGGQCQSETEGATSDIPVLPADSSPQTETLSLEANISQNIDCDDNQTSISQYQDNSTVSEVVKLSEDTYFPISTFQDSLLDIEGKTIEPCAEDQPTPLENMLSKCMVADLLTESGSSETVNTFSTKDQNCSHSSQGQDNDFVNSSLPTHCANAENVQSNSAPHVSDSSVQGISPKNTSEKLFSTDSSREKDIDASTCSEESKYLKSEPLITKAAPTNTELEYNSSPKN